MDRLAGRLGRGWRSSGMISHVELIRRLRHERVYWKKELKTDFERGILRGLQIAMRLAIETKKDRDAGAAQEWRHRRSAS